MDGNPNGENSLALGVVAMLANAVASCLFEDHSNPAYMTIRGLAIIIALAAITFTVISRIRHEQKLVCLVSATVGSVALFWEYALFAIILAVIMFFVALFAEAV